MIDFVEEYKKLQLSTPRLSTVIINSLNSDYCFNVDQGKNLYLVANAVKNQDCMYGRDFYGNSDCMDCDHIKDCSLCFDCINCRNCYNCNSLQDSDGSSDCNSGYYLRACKNCIGCSGLSHKEFYIFNQPYVKEEYFERLKKMNADEVREGFLQVKLQVPRVAVSMINCENCTGNSIYNSRNINEGFDVYDSEDSGYLLETKKLKDCYDISILEYADLCYQVSSSYILHNCNFCYFCMDSSDLEFCECVIASEFCFGCISLHRKKYYILNQPYSEAEYFKTVAEIKADLRARGLYGGMFIPSTFPRSETVAEWEKM